MHAANQNANKKNGTMYVDNTPLFHFQPIPSIRVVGEPILADFVHPIRFLDKVAKNFKKKSVFTKSKVRFEHRT